jgi:hypothetical protein
MASIVVACDVVVIDDLLALSPLVANVLIADGDFIVPGFSRIPTVFSQLCSRNSKQLPSGEAFSMTYTLDGNYGAIEESQ